MKKKIICSFIFLILIIQIPAIISKETNKPNENYHVYDNIDYSKYGNFTITENGMIKTEDGWYYYPPYPNYAPSGIPDFDQRHPDFGWDPGGGGWCGLVAECNLIWYIDSKYSDPNGYPGDGVDIFSLVQNYNAPSIPEPGPNKDDHNYNNVNDEKTSWSRDGDVDDYELIERYAEYFWNEGWNYGPNKFIEDAGLSQKLIYYTKNHFMGFDFDDFIDKILSGEYYIAIRMHGFDQSGLFVVDHEITVAGINVDELKIAVCDSYLNKANPSYDYNLHNDASIVSHDIYNIILDPPIGHWGFDYKLGGCEFAFIDKSHIFRENYQPESPMISGPSNGSISTNYFFNLTSYDKHEDDISYYVDWGDGTNNNWSELFESGENYSINHSWVEEGGYIIQVKAKDEHGSESDWSTLEITMPKNKAIDTPFLQFLENHPHMFPLLRQLLGL